VIYTDDQYPRGEKERSFAVLIHRKVPVAAEGGVFVAIALSPLALAWVDQRKDFRRGEALSYSYYWIV
jgi:hypothetical protein